MGGAKGLFFIFKYLQANFHYYYHNRSSVLIISSEYRPMIRVAG